MNWKKKKFYPKKKEREKSWDFGRIPKNSKEMLVNFTNNIRLLLLQFNFL